MNELYTGVARQCESCRPVGWRGHGNNIGKGAKWRMTYDKTQLPNDQIRRTWCIATRANAFWHYLKWFGTAENLLKTMSLKHAFSWYLKRFETAENILKTMSLKHALWRYLKRFGTAENFSKQCLQRMYSDGIWNDLELQRKKWKQCL